jgi:DNA-binding Xre family transcriptional regulator
MAEEFQYPHIGKKITEVLQSKFWTKTELGDIIGMSQSNAIYLTNRKNIDVENLHKISVALRHNFFKYYPVEEAPIEKGKETDVLKQKIAELEKQVEQQKVEIDNLKKENGYLNEINGLLKRK